MDIFAEIEISEAPSERKTVSPNAQIVGGATDPVRQKFYDMRGMASDNPYTWNDARLFYKQAKFMENFTDNYESFAEFSMHCPCYQRMGYERLRTYFTWRAAVRRGEFLDTSLSYIFLYIYELLACIGEESPVKSLVGLWALRGAYSKKFLVLDEYLPEWLKDFHVYYELPHSFTEFVTEHNMSEFYSDLFLFDGDAEVSVWNKISAYDVSKSKFYTESAENTKLLDDCFKAVGRGLAALCAEKGICVKDLFVHTGNQQIPWFPFRRALFHRWLRQKDRQIELPGGEIFICENNEWLTFHTAPYAHKKELAAFIIRKTEAQVRAVADFKTKITADPSTLLKASAALGGMGVTVREIENVIEKSIAEFFTEKNRIIVNIDRKNLERIRVEAEDITEKLIVEDETPLPRVACADNSGLKEQPVPELGDVWAQFFSQLSDAELAALKMILSENDDINKIKTFADSKGLMLEILADNINEKAIEIIGDNILELTDTLTVYDEYKNFLAHHFCKCIG
ncbi:MAG: TerB N-terminal domain-containing protein [Defluviitaleaceae bacterium]|nr:TerB N-terminal domain-containing protein [Defluviitaleaceae bacterium]